MSVPFGFGDGSYFDSALTVADRVIQAMIVGATLVTILLAALKSCAAQGCRPLTIVLSNRSRVR